MTGDLVYLIKSFLLKKAMLNTLQKKYGVLFDTRLRALEINVGKFKCANNKGLEKHLLTLNAHFTNL